MKIRNDLAMAFFLALLIASIISMTNPRVKEVAAQPQYGPRAPGLVITQYTTDAAAWMAFSTLGMEDYFGPIDSAQFGVAITDPEIILQPHMGLTITSEVFMENETVPSDLANLNTPWVVGGTRGDYPIANPLSVDAFKKALLCLAQRDYWVDIILGGFGQRCDAAIPVPEKSWWNPAVTGDNWPFPYDLTYIMANKLLDHAVEFFDMFHVSGDLIWEPMSGIGTVFVPGVHYVGGALSLTLTQPVVEIEHVYALYPNGTSIILRAGIDYVYVGGRTISIIKPGLPESTMIFVEYIGNIEEHFHVPENVTAPPSPQLITLTHPVSEVVRVRTVERELVEGMEWVWIVSTKTVEILIELPNCTDVWVEYWFGFLDLDGDNIRNFPHGWQNALIVGGVPENIPPLIYYVCDIPATRVTVANNWAADMLAVGIPTNVRVRASAIINDVCWFACSYQICTDERSVGKYPTYLMSFFHSWNWKPSYTGSNAYTPGHADLDYALENAYYATTIEDIFYYVQLAQFLQQKKYALWCPWSTAKTFLAYRDLQALVYTTSKGLWETYSQLSMYKASVPTASIRIALYPPVILLNPVYARWVTDRFALGLVIEDAVNLNPWDIYTEQPGLCKDWEMFTWYDPADGRTKLGIRYWVRTDAKWTRFNNVTNQVDALGSYGARDAETSDWYLFQTPDAWFHSYYRDIHHIITNPANNMIEYYFDDYALIWYMDTYPWAGPMSPQAYKQAPLATLKTETFVEGVDFTYDPNSYENFLPLPWFDVGAPFDIVYVYDDGADLTEYQDYNIVKGYVNISKAIGPGSVIEIKYWGTGSASGHTPGGINWRLTVGIGNGPWVLKEYFQDPGGVIVYVRNPYCLWETPPYGEVDWIWYWTGTTKPRGGYFWVFIFDVVLATGSYEAQGRRVPDRYWYAGADFAPGLWDPADLILKPGLTGTTGPGKIDIFDIVQLSPNYDLTFQIS